MGTTHATRAGVLGLLALAGLAGPAPAGHFFRKCHPDCEKEVVRLPAREIVVESAPPRVIVNEARIVERARRAVVPAAPVVATVFTPSYFALPAAPAPLAFTRECPLPERGRDILRTAHELEYQAMELEKLRAAQRAEQAATERIYGRISASLRAGGGALGQKGEVGQSVEAEIFEELRKLNERITNLEKLVIKHDDYIRAQMKGGKGP